MSFPTTFKPETVARHRRERMQFQRDSRANVLRSRRMLIGMADTEARAAYYREELADVRARHKAEPLPRAIA